MTSGREAAACRMSFARRLLDGKPGRCLHVNSPGFCTSALVCEARTPALSVASHDWRCGSSASLRRYSRRIENSGGRTCLEWPSAMARRNTLLHPFPAVADGYQRQAAKRGLDRNRRPWIW